MKLRRKRQRRRIEAVIPLVNIGFLMLVFILLAGNLRVATPFNVTPPLSQTGEEERARELTIHVSFNGEIAIGGMRIGEGELAGALGAQLANGGEKTVRLIADRALDGQRLVPLMETLRAAGARRLVLITRRGGR